MYRRYCRLTITPETEQTTDFFSLGTRMGSFANNNSITLTETTGIDFNIQSSPTGFGNKAEITLYGLSSDTNFFMSKMINKYINTPVTFLFTLDAGSYDNHGIIFCGRAIKSVVDESKADYSVTMSLLGEYPKIEIFTLNFNGQVDLGTSIKTYFEQRGYKVENNLIGLEAITVSNLYMKDKTIDEICSQISMDYKKQQVFMDVYPEEKIIRLGKVGDLTGKNGESFLLSESTGMIGSPNPSIAKKVDAKMILNPSVTDQRYGRRVSIDSIKFPELKDNKFGLVSVNHRGQTRGNIWETSLELGMEGFGWVNANW